MKKFLMIVGAILLIVVLAKVMPPVPPKTLEETAMDRCLGQGASVRQLVEIARQAGVSTDDLRRWEFAICTSREEAVLKEEVRRGLRSAFAPVVPVAPKEAKAATEMPCPPSYWMTSDGCKEVIAAGGLSR